MTHTRRMSSNWRCIEDPPHAEGQTSRVGSSGAGQRHITKPARPEKAEVDAHQPRDSADSRTIASRYSVSLRTPTSSQTSSQDSSHWSTGRRAYCLQLSAADFKSGSKELEKVEQPPFSTAT